MGNLKNILIAKFPLWRYTEIIKASVIIYIQLWYNHHISMENSSSKQNKARRGSKVAKERELMYARIEQKFGISQKEIRDHHKKFLREQKNGEMSKTDFLKFADSERIKPFVAQSLFRLVQDDS